jgi:hypothetical protein
MKHATTTEATMDTKKAEIRAAAHTHRDETNHLVVIGKFDLTWTCLGCLESGSVYRKGN